MIDRFDGKYKFLSNFYVRPIQFCGLNYRNAEAAFQSHKTQDLAKRVEFCELPPNEAKALGRRVKLVYNWDDIKDNVMLALIRKKFSPVSDIEMAKALNDTMPHELVEGNYWHDNYWGNCTCDKCKDIQGRNTLGIILMQVRDENKLYFNMTENMYW